ncbi:hypothetical protein OTK49_21060 [Vibrio coralliirubri]|uniref:hypothetical protein n=1 Tax=Vibrio coralliirubri TaxID=1516159 RepID=UPI002284E54F|nr:hypothetical protein [Vibrio coralliirubri]MCY9865010.1 hypothetical protein [Vibrio coralliirubri]
MSDLKTLLSNPEVVVALIETGGSVCTVLIPAMIGLKAVKELLRLKYACQSVITSLHEVSCLRELYSEACNRLAAYEGKTMKGVDNVIRKEMAQSGIKSEGKLPPSEIARKLKSYTKALKRVSGFQLPF